MTSYKQTIKRWSLLFIFYTNLNKSVNCVCMTSSLFASNNKSGRCPYHINFGKHLQLHFQHRQSTISVGYVRVGIFFDYTWFKQIYSEFPGTVEQFWVPLSWRTGGVAITYWNRCLPQHQRGPDNEPWHLRIACYVACGILYAYARGFSLTDRDAWITCNLSKS